MFNLPKKHRPKDFGITNPDRVGATYINVVDYSRARTNEMNKLIFEVSEIDGNKRAFQSLPRHARRRAASHNIHRIPSCLRARTEKENASARPKTPEKKQKRWRRRRSKDDFQLRSGAKWLDTHVWHAKRFHMDTLWGYKVPLRPTQKSNRSSVHAARHIATIQDTSFYHTFRISVDNPSDWDSSHALLISLPFFSQGDSLGNIALKHGSRLGSADFSLLPPFPLSLGPVKFFFSPPLNSLFFILHPASLSLLSHPLPTLLSSSLPPTLSITDVSDSLGMFSVLGPKSNILLHRSFPAKGGPGKHVFDLISEVSGPVLPKFSGFSCELFDPRLFPLEKSLDQSVFDRSTSALSFQTPPPAHVSSFRPFSAISYSSIASVQDSVAKSPPRELGKLISNWSYTGSIVNFDKCFNFSTHPETNSSVCQRRSESGVFNAVLPSSEDFPGPHVTFYQCNSIDPRGVGSGYLMIVPKNWVSVLWNSLVFHGGKPIGVDDSHSITTEIGDVWFPLIIHIRWVVWRKRTSFLNGFKFPFWNWFPFTLISICLDVEGDFHDVLKGLLRFVVEGNDSDDQLINQVTERYESPVIDWIKFDCDMITDPSSATIPSSAPVFHVFRDLNSSPPPLSFVYVSINPSGVGVCPPNSLLFEFPPNGSVMDRFEEEKGGGSELMSENLPKFKIIGVVSSGIPSLKRGRCSGVGLVNFSWLQSKFKRGRVTALCRHGATEVYRPVFLSVLI
ncbi:hypothetical protein GEMRC1_006216 [Eukaryota sp. GEM-RC1]